MRPDAPYPRLLVAGPASGAGKTTVTLALLAAFARRGRRVQAFKVGPDFIDPGHHTAVTGRPSRNLDGWMLDPAANRAIFRRAAMDADLAIIEGMMGLFDGSSPVSETGSAAELAKQLGVPVLLVVDGSSIARSAAALVHGFARFDPGLQMAGVLFNRVSGESHYRLLEAAVTQGAGVPVVGYLRADATLTIADRHLGLVTALEHGGMELYARLGRAAAETVDLDLVEQAARSAGPLPGWDAAETDRPRRGQGDGAEPVVIAVAADPAFCFYYPDNLDALEAAGARIARFSPLADARLPAADLLYFGGGYPELYAARLARNEPMRRAIREFAAAGGAIYAECGGLMYLTEAIRDLEGVRHEMVGCLPAEALMQRERLTIGYRELTLTEPCLLGEPGTRVRGHEFHYSSLRPTGPLRTVARLTGAGGDDRGPDGVATGRVVALYTHLHFASHPSVADALVGSVRRGSWAARAGGPRR